MKALVLISLLGAVALFTEMFNLKKLTLPLVIVGLLAVFGINFIDWNTDTLHFGMMLYDNYSVAFSGLMVFITFIWFLMSRDFFVEKSSVVDHSALILFSLAGGIVMVSFSNLTMLFLGLEMLSIAVYVLAGSSKDDTLSNEAAFKYFLMGAFASGFLLFGIALLYGATGTFDNQGIADYTASAGTLPGIYYAGIILMIVGLGFKSAVAPFHFWTPDVYDGAPTQVTSYMATIVKIAAFGAFFRLFNVSFSAMPEAWTGILGILAVLTLFLGGITAVFQSHVKRLLAYSSVSHAGYILLAIIAMDAEFSKGAIFFYLTAYSIATVLAFYIMHLVEKNAKEGNKISAFYGLGKRNPLLALTMTISMLSLAGIPPTGGFFGKYYIFTAAINNGYVWLVILAIIATLIGIYYYFKIIVAMYLYKDEGIDQTITLNSIEKVLIIICSALIIALGVFPNLIAGLI